MSVEEMSEQWVVRRVVRSSSVSDGLEALAAEVDSVVDRSLDYARMQEDDDGDGGEVYSIVSYWFANQP